MTPPDYLYPVHGRSFLEKELDDLLSEGIDSKYKLLVTFQKRIIRYKDHLFTFLYDPAVPSHNNDSEKAIRNVKVKQKVSGQFKTLTGAGNFAILRSIIDTAIKNKQDVMEALNVVAHYHKDCLLPTSGGYSSTSTIFLFIPELIMILQHSYS